VESAATSKLFCCFDYTFPHMIFPAKVRLNRRSVFRLSALLTLTFWFSDVSISDQAAGQTPPATVPSPLTPKPRKSRPDPGTRRFAARADALLTVSPVNKGEWGVLIVDAASGVSLYELNADKFFVPASNMKLFTTALALSKLGPDFRFHTTLETRGSLSADGVLSGDLYLVGRGDPNLSNRKFPYELKEEFDGPPDKALAELADAVLAKGVKEISGDIVGDDSYFPREPYPSGWEIDDMVWEYGAAVSAIVVDDNTATLTLTAGAAAGAPVQAVVTPATPDFVVQNAVVTSAPEIKPDLTLMREPDSNLVLIRGSLPAQSSPRRLILGIHEPALHAASLLRDLLMQRGIRIGGGIRATHAPDPVSSTPRAVLAEHVSIPLSDSVKLVNKISQNLHTEMLLRAAARNIGIWNTPDDLMKFPADFYTSAGIPAGDVVQTDASGLSRHDLVTPRAIVALLNYAQSQPWFAPYFASLPIAGVDGTLEPLMKNTISAGRIHAKTGSVEHVRTRSGYADTVAGRRLIFSFMSNNQSGKNHEASDTLDALCLAMMEEFDPRPPARRAEARRRSALALHR
jgi:serine-type D-Ala-D-Ala carboxypeptidase/endopeptidase (penicillin-binding protein 4)